MMQQRLAGTRKPRRRNSTEERARLKLALPDGTKEYNTAKRAEEDKTARLRARRLARQAEPL